MDRLILLKTDRVERWVEYDYGIFYDNKRGHERKIILKRLEPRE